VVARLARAQKSNRGAGGYSRWVNRPLGRQFAALAYLAGLTPNQVSCLSALCTYAGIALVAVVTPSWPSAVLVMVLLVVGYALDSADGQVARLRGSGSPAGEWLDHVFDAIKIATFHLAVAICWYRHYDVDRPALLLVPLGFSAVATVFFFAITLSDMLRRIERQRAGGVAVTTASVNPDERAPVLRSLVVLPNDYGVLCLVTVLLAAHPVFVVVYTALFVAASVFLVAGLARWFREMTSLGR
jgi:phosphatidylglycerophosphate synthase